MTPTTSLVEHAVLAAADAAAIVLPASELLAAGRPQPADATTVAGFAAAVTAPLTGGRSGTLTLLVGPELVAALQQGAAGLELAPAVQPALDAAARELGAAVDLGRVSSPEQALAAHPGPARLVPLQGSVAVLAALLLSDTTATSAAGAPGVGSTSTGHVGSPAPAPRGIEMLHGVDMEVTVELGRTRMTVRDLLALAPGQVLVLDRAAGGPVDLLVNGRLIARGEVVVVDEDFGLRVTEILDETGVV